MPTDHRAELHDIRTFPSLVRYLRDEMGWPINTADFEELTFEYTPEELGIDAKNAAKIQEIKRLRPLTPKQPWGIFFVKFEPKRLPVVALRRILSQVALRKRASANSAERAAWAADDLLFVSNYGEGDERQISFAHFSRAQDGHDLPTLKVLGWDNRDTALHLDAVARELTEHLAWPDDDDAEAWRMSWRAAFTLRHREVVTTSKELSIRLAGLARDIRDRIKTALAIETDKGPLTQLMKAFQEALVHDLDADGFADMYAQTIAYGLLSARIADPHKKTANDFATHMRTNPFLRELMETFLKVGGRRGKAGGPGIDFDELGVSEVVELLDDPNTRMEAVVRDFGDRNRDEDPVTHFYELFLHEYDRKLKVQRGVFYTPQPVVSYIVRSVHELLQTEFGLAEGLAETTTWGEMLKKHPGLRLPPLTNEPGEERTISPDEPFVQILDPATGTATFLVEAIDVIHRTLVAKWKRERLTDADQRAAWNDYVPRHLLPRLHAFELMMAPYAIAHMKVGLKLAETGYRFGTEERARIYLTNALEPWVKQLPLIGVDALAHEAAAVNEIKRHKRFTVVIGNPPYARDSRNRSTFIEKLMDRYKAAVRDERNLQPLGDDCIKFICLGHASVENSGAGVLSYISNNKYLSGATIHRGIREELAKTFDSIQITNLHGDVGHPTDRNVFAIREGVTIATFARRLESASARSVRYREVFGAAEMKCAALLAPQTLSSWTALPIVPPQFFFIPTSSEHASDLDSAISVAEMFGNGSTTDKGTRWGNGVKTNRDDLLIADTRRELTARFAAFEDATLSDAELADRFALTDGPYWETARERQKVLNGEWRTKVLPYCYRPFSNRWILYLTNLMEIGRGGASKHVMKHMMHPNLGLVTHRTASKQLDYTHFFAVNALIDVRTFPDREGVPYLFPLYVYPDGSSQATLAGMQDERRPNLSRTFLSRLSNALRLPPSGNLGLPHGLTPEDIFHYAYAVFHSPGYRSRYAEFLKIDFPRLPLTGNLELFRALARLGGELTALHLLESTKLAQPITAFIGGPKNGHGPEVETISWSRSTVWVDKAQTTGFQGVREDVWNFHIGGYQVCEKWLKDRKGRTLSKDDIAHYQKIVVALAETIRLMKEIDEVIERHGGWPGGFEQGAVEAQALEAAEKTEHYRT